MRTAFDPPPRSDLAPARGPVTLSGVRRASGAGIVLLALLAGLWWSLRRAARGDEGFLPPPARFTGEDDRVESGLRGLPPLEAASVGASSSPVPATEPERTARPSTRAPRTRELVRGRLVIAESGAPLDEVLKLRLRTGDVSVIEDLVTAPDGSFTSTTSFPRGLLLLKVFRPNGDMAADLEGPFDPAAPEEWVVAVPWPTFVHGAVLDRDGRALPGLELALVPRGSGAEVVGGRTRDGEFLLPRVALGRHTLHFWLGLETHSLELEVRRGPNELGELRLPLGEVAGGVSGRLIAADGTPVAMLLLVDPSNDTIAAVETEPVAGARGESTFQFENVPTGRYRLELLALDGLRYEPAGLSLSPPALGLEFRAVGAAEGFRWSGVDEAGETLDTLGLVRLRGQWLLDSGAFALPEVEGWVALSNGHRPVAGERPVGGESVVRFEPGHGQAFLFTQGGGDPLWALGGGARRGMLAGVQVVADGRVAATSDAQGLALVSLTSAPEELEFRLPGWHIVDQTLHWLLTSVAMAPD